MVEYRIVYPAVTGSNPVVLAMVVVAQLVEHWIVIPRVAGSSPVNYPYFGGLEKYGELSFLFPSGSMFLCTASENGIITLYFYADYT